MLLTVCEPGPKRLPWPGAPAIGRNKMLTEPFHEETPQNPTWRTLEPTQPSLGSLPAKRGARTESALSKLKLVLDLKNKHSHPKLDNREPRNCQALRACLAKYRAGPQGTEGR